MEAELMRRRSFEQAMALKMEAFRLQIMQELSDEQSSRLNFNE